MFPSRPDDNEITASDIVAAVLGAAEAAIKPKKKIDFKPVGYHTNPYTGEMVPIPQYMEVYVTAAKKDGWKIALNDVSAKSSRITYLKNGKVHSSYIIDKFGDSKDVTKSGPSNVKQHMSHSKKGKPFVVKPHTRKRRPRKHGDDPWNDPVQRALGNYQSGSATMNRYLRTGKAVGGYIKEDTLKFVKIYDQVATKWPTNTVVYRGFGGLDRHFKVQKASQLLGTKFTDNGFVSASFDLKVATRFAEEDGAIFKILVPKGTKALSMNQVLDERMNDMADEKELILSKGGTYRIPKNQKITYAVKTLWGEPRKIPIIKVERIK